MRKIIGNHESISHWGLFAFNFLEDWGDNCQLAQKPDGEFVRKHPNADWANRNICLKEEGGKLSFFGVPVVKKK